MVTLENYFVFQYSYSDCCYDKECTIHNVTIEIWKVVRCYGLLRQITNHNCKYSHISANFKVPHLYCIVKQLQ